MVIFDPNCHFWPELSFVVQMVIFSSGSEMKSKVVFDNEYGLFDRTWWNGHFWPRCFLSFTNYLYVRFTIDWFFVNPINSAFPNFMPSAPIIFRFNLVYSGFGSEFFEFQNFERIKGTWIHFSNRSFSFHPYFMSHHLTAVRQNWPKLQNFRLNWPLALSSTINSTWYPYFKSMVPLKSSYNSFKLDYVNPN